MKTITLFISLFVLNIQIWSQTYGIYTETDIYKLDGDLFECDSCLTAIQSYDGDNILFPGEEFSWKVEADSSYFGQEALHIQFSGANGDDRVWITVDSLDIDQTLNFSQWNDDADVVFYIKLIDPMDLHLELESNRNFSGLNGSDEPLSWWGLNTNNTDTWQKIYVDPTHFEGNYHDFTEFLRFAWRSRGFASNFILDEVYVLYGLKEFGIYADSSELKGEGSLDPSNVITQNGATITAVPGLVGDGLHVTFAGGGSDRVIFPATSTGDSASYPRWNDRLANLVFFIKLNQPIDLSLEISALRNGDNINASDEPLSQHGLDINNTVTWQRIVIDLAEGLEGDNFDYTQFESFRLRSRDNASDFIVDEIHVRYPENETPSAVETVESLPSSFSLKQNYPNPFNPATTIEFSLSKSTLTTLRVYNVLGQEVAELINNEINAGTHRVNFNASNLPSGVYFYKLESDNNSQVKKMLLLK
jgi:hypothetical protein